MYNNLLTKSFDNLVTNNNKTIIEEILIEEILIEAIKNCQKNCAFSTFMYIFHKYNSLQSIDKTQSGNCISLSIYIQKYLFKKYKIISFLIPATIPNKYTVKGYLDISHVALAIKFNENIIYIVDPAFYFLNPIKINKKNMTCSTIYCKDIYQNTTDIINSCPKRLNNDKIFNKYQTIPKYTYYAKSYYIQDKNDYWYYFLTEILNPDEAISSFFIPIKKYPFLVTTILDDNGVCKLHTHIKITNDLLIITDSYNNNNSYNLKDLNQNTIDYLNLNLNKFFIETLNYYIKNASNKINQYIT